MYGLTKKQKLDFVLEKVAEMNLTAYEIGKKTDLSMSGIEKILNKTSKKPQEETLNKIILFLESLVLGKNYKEPSSETLILNEEKTIYSQDDLEKNPLVKCLNEKNKLFVEVVKLQSILRNNNIDFKNIFEDLEK